MDEIMYGISLKKGLPVPFSLKNIVFLYKEGYKNGALTEQFDDLKSFNLGGTTRDPNYTPGVNFLDHDLL